MRVAETTPIPASSAPVLASIKRSPCFGPCPSYDVVVYEDGVVAYHGVYAVVLRGNHTFALKPDQIAALRTAFVDGGFADFKTQYASFDSTCAPTVQIRFEDKTVVHYLGDRSAPRALIALEDQFDQIVGSERWIGTEDERTKMWWEKWD